MNPLERGLLFARRATLPLAVTILGACGGDGGGVVNPPPPSPKPVITASVPSGLEGSIGRISVSATNSPTSISVDDPNTPSVDYSSNGSAIDVPYTIESRDVIWSISATNNNGTTTTTQTTQAIPLSVQASWNKNTILAGESASCKVDAPSGADSVFATIQTQPYAAAGNSATFNFTANNAGTYTCIPKTKHNAVEKTGTAAMITAMPKPAPTARNFTLQLNEAGQVVVDFDSVSLPAGLGLTMNGSKATIKGAQVGTTTWDDVNGAFQLQYKTKNLDGQETTAQGNINITAQPDWTITPKDRIDGGTLSAFTIKANNAPYTINGVTKLQLPAGAVTFEVVTNQPTHNFYHMKFSDGRPAIVVDSGRINYTTNIGSTDAAVDLGSLERSRHPEFSGKSYEVFRTQWATIKPPIRVDSALVFTKGSVGGGVFGCDQTDMTQAQLSASREATDSLRKYITPYWPNAVIAEVQSKPQFITTPLGGTQPVDYQEVFCPGNIASGAIVRNGLTVAASIRDRGGQAGSNFNERAPFYWGRPSDIESQGYQGFSMFEQASTKPWPHALDIKAWKLVGVAIDGEKQDKKGLTF
jgi:hypothetical protein